MGIKTVAVHSDVDSSAVSHQLNPVLNLIPKILAGGFGPEVEACWSLYTEGS